MSIEVVSLTDQEIFSAHRAFHASIYGQKLAERVRYEKYNVSGMPYDEWMALLGADVNNLTHMPLTYGLTKSFIRESQTADTEALSQNDAVLLKMGALIHDQGEAIIGDISYGDKTEDDEIAEHEAFSLHQISFSDGVSMVVRQAILSAREEVVFDAKTPLGRMFNAIEAVGYLRTALRAAQATHETSDSHINDGLRWLVADVLGNITPKITVYANEYPAVQKYVTAKCTSITHAFDTIEPRDFINYGDAESQKQKQFLASRALWGRWIADTSG